MNSNNSLTLSFDTHYRQYDNQTATVLVSYYDTMKTNLGDSAELLRYDNNISSDNKAVDVLDGTVTIPFDAPDDVKYLVISWRLSDAGNDWYWGVDNVSVVQR
ncbi:MAG: hypothetical protein HRU07_05895 [Nitrosopumilus sp.]|nr:hypothetical protein [Nitrosopumilus sp.]NRA05678.1 hypothetical protein [Nitrosopumilus sp.]